MDFHKLGKIGAKAHWQKEHKKIIDYISNNSDNFVLEKARIIGFIMGDGSISKLGKPLSLQQHKISFYPDDLGMLNLFLKDFETVYCKKPTLKNLGSYFSVRVDSKPACDDLRSFGKFDSLNWKLPEKLKSREEQIEWLRAIFDCEASVGARQIQLQSVSKEGINSLIGILNQLGIKSQMYLYDRKHPGWNINYILAITQIENIIKYKDLIGFNHFGKKKKLDNLAHVA